MLFALLFSFRLKKKMCICRDNQYWKKLKQSGTEKMKWGWEWRLLKSKSFLSKVFMLVKGRYALSFWLLVDRECYCICATTGLVKFTRRRSRPLKRCWGGENCQWKPWKTHMIKGWRMNFLGIYCWTQTVTFVVLFLCFLFYFVLFPFFSFFFSLFWLHSNIH